MNAWPMFALLIIPLVIIWFATRDLRGPSEPPRPPAAKMPRPAKVYNLDAYRRRTTTTATLRKAA